MNILTITASDSGIGGASRVAMDLHAHYRARGHDTHVFAGKKSSRLDSVTELHRPLWRKAAAYALANDFDFFDGSQILRSEQFQRADVVHCHNLSGWYFNLAILPQMSRLKPVVWTLHDMWAITPHAAYTSSRHLQYGLFHISDQTAYPATLWNNDRYLARRKLEIYERSLVHVATPCRWLADLVDKTRLGLKPKNVIFNGIDTTQYQVRSKSAERSRLGLRDVPTALFVGAAATTNQFKGYADFEWLARSAPGHQFVCVGAQADETVDSVIRFKATADKARVASFLSAADVLVMPSSHEVFPLVMIEALASGTPVVAYDVGGIGELIGRISSCALVPAGNRDKLLAAVLARLDSPQSGGGEVAERLRRHVETDYSLEAMGSHYLALFEELVRSRRRS